MEEGELLDDGEVDEKVEESQIVDPPAVIPSLLDMKISPPRNGKIFLIKHNIQHYMHILFFMSVIIRKFAAKLVNSVFTPHMKSWTKSAL